MNTKTMEGLIGAGTNIKLVDTPMRVYREARRKDDTATMERAMGYATEFAGKADKYSAQADEGTLEEAKEARKKAELEREEAIEKRREERERLTEQIENTSGENTNPADTIVDTVEISAAGKALLNQEMPAEGATAEEEK